ESLKYSGEDCPQKLSNEYPIVDLIKSLEEYNLFLAERDLEYDLIDSPLNTSLQEHYGKKTPDSLHTEMSKKKGENMFFYSEKYFEEFKKIDKELNIYVPLDRLKELANGGINE